MVKKTGRERSTDSCAVGQGRGEAERQRRSHEDGHVPNCIKGRRRVRCMPRARMSRAWHGEQGWRWARDDRSTGRAPSTFFSIISRTAARLGLRWRQR